MSLILEALRKSEAQRRLGRAPDLMSETPAAAPVRRRAMPAWPWFAAGLLLVALTAWWLGRQTGTEQAPPVATPGPVPAEPLTESVEPLPAASAPATLDPPAVPVERRAPVPPPVQATTAQSRSTDEKPAPAVELPDGPASVQELARLRQRLEALAAAEVAAADQAGATARPAPAPPAATQLPRFEELPAAERGDRPELKFSLHVFTEDPAGRFVVLDGRRLVEGTAISPRTVLTEIRRDGAVVEIDGRPVLVPRP